MAIKQRMLDKLATIEKDLMEASEAESQEALADALELLSETKNEYRQGLPESRHADYDELCDGLLFAVTQLVSGQATEDKGEVLSLCSDLLQILNKKIEDEGGFKKEIVFLPYKSSMWDSLESVWRAACEDKEQCAPYVIPIPYADLTPEHTVAEWHCEKDMFPKDVPVVDWQTVDLEKMHPDVIFIHNPYDEYNRVTSVESRYYSSNLKKCTNKLVYIPYFVLDEPEFDSKTDEEIEKMEENIAHFVTTPAVLNADQVVVQSEAMRRVYIDVLTRETNQKERAYWEKRIVGTGSPKFDKVTENKKEAFKLPEEWTRLINGRKIILYNTGLSTMLLHSDKYIEKVKFVLEMFKEHEDVALWWRPHPLLRATFQSMHPELLKEYDEIVNTYRREGWGIYDDTAELERSVFFSDGYYGDGSSVIQLYKKTGKPIFIQNSSDFFRSYLYQSVSSRISFIDIVTTGDNAYFFDFYYNALFEVNLNTETLMLKKIFNSIGGTDSHAAIAVWNSKLIVAPRCDNKIIKYDIEKDVYEFIFLECIDNISEKKYLFNSIEIFNDYAYLIPGRYPGIIKLNLNTNEIKEINSWYKEYIYLWKKNTESMIFHTCRKLTDKKIMLTCWRSNRIWFFDLESEIMEYIKVGRRNSPLHDVALDGDKIWVSYQGENEAIYVFKDYRKQEKRYWIGGMDSHFEGGFYLHKYKGDLYAFPTYGSHILKYNNQNDCFEKFKKITLKPRLYVNRDKQYFLNYLCIKHVNKNISILDSVYDNQIWWINWKEKIIKKINITTDEETSKKLFMNKLKLVCKKGYVEDSVIGLKDFLLYINEERDSISVPMSVYTDSCGRRIYEKSIGKSL